MGDTEAYMAAIQLFFAGLGICVVLGIIFLAGRWQDTFWRHRQKRGLMKKDYYTLGFISKDAKEISPFIVEAKNSALVFKNNLWIAANDRVYRVSEAQLSKDAKFETLADGSLQITIKNVSKSDGFDIKSENTRIKTKSFLGLPFIFVSEDTYKPIGFEQSPALKAEEVHSALNTYVVNEMSQGMKKSNEDIAFYLQIGTFALAAIAAYLSFTNNSMLTDLGKAVSGIAGNILQLLPK